MSKYKSSKSSAYRKPMWIDSNDPRARSSYDIEKYRSRIGAEVVVRKNTKKNIELDEYQKVLEWLPKFLYESDYFQLKDIKKIGSNIFAYGGYPDLVMSSDNGNTWQVIQQPTEIYNWVPRIGSYQNKIFLVYADYSPATTYLYSSSNNGTSWNLDLTISEKTPLTLFTVNNKIYLWTMDSSSPFTRRVYISEDGGTTFSQNVTSGSFSIGSGPAPIEYANNIFVAAQYGGIPKYSSDGISWQNGNYTEVNSGSIESIKYLNSQWWGISGADNYGIKSPDGINWTEWQQPGIGYNFYDIAYGNGKYVLVGDYISSYYSSDGNSWIELAISQESYINQSSWRQVIFSNGRFIACANPFDTGYPSISILDL